MTHHHADFAFACALAAGIAVFGFILIYMGVFN
jgi:hypothetical protein